MNNLVDSNSNTAPNSNAELPMAAFSAYDSQLPIAAVVDKRIVKCLYQAAKKGEAPKFPNSYIVIPDHISQKAISENLDALSPYLISFLQDSEKELIKAHHKSGATRLSDSSFNMAGIISYLESLGGGSRLTGAEIKQWFKEVISEKLGELFAAKMNVTLDEASAEQLEKILGIVTAYEVKFASLASPKSNYAIADIDGLIKVIASCSAESVGLGLKLTDKLVKMKEPKKEVLLELL